MWDWGRQQVPFSSFFLSGISADWINLFPPRYACKRDNNDSLIAAEWNFNTWGLIWKSLYNFILRSPNTTRRRIGIYRWQVWEWKEEKEEDPLATWSAPFQEIAYFKSQGKEIVI